MGDESDPEKEKPMILSTEIAKDNIDKIFADDKFSKRERKGHMLL